MGQLIDALAAPEFDVRPDDLPPELIDEPLILIVVAVVVVVVFRSNLAELAAMSRFR